MDLSSKYLGLSLRTPLVASPSALTADVAGLRRLEDAGASAVVLASLFEEEILLDSMDLDAAMESWVTSFGEAPSYLEELRTHRTRPDQYLKFIEDAKQALDIPVIASLNVHAPGPWMDQVEHIDRSGADALELTIFGVAADPNTAAQKVEQHVLEIVRTVRGRLRIPLSVKIAPFFSALSHTARQLTEDGGADGLVLFHRGYLPYLDVQTIEVTPVRSLSGSAQVGLPVRWVAILRDFIEASLGATGGVHTDHDVIRLLLAGADAVMMSSALLENGPEHLKTLEKGLAEWMAEQQYASVEQLKGSASRESMPEPAVYERVSYVKSLWSCFRSLAR